MAFSIEVALLSIKKTGIILKNSYSSESTTVIECFLNASKKGTNNDFTSFSLKCTPKFLNPNKIAFKVISSKLLRLKNA